MQKPETDQSSQKKEFKDIATILGVPEHVQEHFVTEALELSDFMNDYRGYGRYVPALRSLASPKLLKQANQDLKTSIDCLREQAFALSGAASIKFRRTLAQLLDHPIAKTLLPDQKFVSYDDIPQMNNVLRDKPKKAEALDEISVSYAADPASTFIVLLELLQAGLATDLEHCEKSTGGRPEKWLRGHCIKELLLLHDQTFGDSATSTPGGVFSNMCHFLFESFGESTDGLDEAIKRFLRKQPL